MFIQYVFDCVVYQADSVTVQYVTVHVVSGIAGTEDVGDVFVHGFDGVGQFVVQ
jgi:hypothetical protein